MYVPSLAGKRSGEVGHPSFQHPQRLREGTFSPEVDRFPLLLIATALRCLQVDGPALWQQYDNGDNLLFGAADLKSPRESALFRELQGLSDPGARMLVNLLVKALDDPLEAAPLLDDVLSRLKPFVPQAPPSLPPVPRRPQPLEKSAAEVAPLEPVAPRRRTAMPPAAAAPTTPGPAQRSGAEAPSLAYEVVDKFDHAVEELPEVVEDSLTRSGMKSFPRYRDTANSGSR